MDETIKDFEKTIGKTIMNVYRGKFNSDTVVIVFNDGSRIFIEADVSGNGIVSDFWDH